MKKLQIAVICALFALVAGTQEFPHPGPQNPNCRFDTPRKPFGAIPSEFNAFFHGDFSAVNSDVEGRTGCGGNLSVRNFAFGCQTFNPNLDGPTCINFGSVTCQDIANQGAYPWTVVVDKDASFTNTQVYSGKVTVGGNPGATGPSNINIVADCGGVQSARPVDFDSEFDYLTKLSDKIANLPTTQHSVNNYYGQITLKGTNQPILEVFSVDASVLANCNQLSITDVSSTATIIVNVVGTTFTMRYFSMESLKSVRQNLLFNANQATSLVLNSISVEGSILAPRADCVDPQGVIWGQMLIKSLTTSPNFGATMQINHRQFNGCLPPVDNPPPPTDCEHPFGSATIFDVFVCQDYQCSQSDVEGRLAAGGNITVVDFSIGCLIFPPHAQGSTCINNNEYKCADFTDGNADSVVAGNSVDATRTEVKVGNIAYGNAYSGGATIAASDCNARQSSSFDFGMACATLRGICDSLTGASSTGSYTAEYNQLVLTGSGEAVEVFNIPGLLLSSAVSFELRGIADKASVIINVNGHDLRLGNFGFLGSFPTDYVVWNFCEAETLSFYNVGWKGTVLAPNADIVNPTGVVQGQVFANSWSGVNCMQQNFAPYKGCLLEAPVS